MNKKERELLLRILQEDLELMEWNWDKYIYQVEEQDRKNPYGEYPECPNYTDDDIEIVKGIIEKIRKEQK